MSHAVKVLELNQSCLFDTAVSWSTVCKIKTPVVNVQNPAITNAKSHIALLSILIRLTSSQQKNLTNL